MPTKKEVNDLKRGKNLAKVFLTWVVYLFLVFAFSKLMEDPVLEYTELIIFSAIFTVITVPILIFKKKNKYIWLGAAIGLILFLPIIQVIQSLGFCPDVLLVNRGEPCSPEGVISQGLRCEDGRLYSTNPSCITRFTINKFYGDLPTGEDQGVLTIITFPLLGLLLGAIIGTVFQRIHPGGLVNGKK